VYEAASRGDSSRMVPQWFGCASQRTHSSDRPRAATLTDLQALLDEFTDCYDHRRSTAP